MRHERTLLAAALLVVAAAGSLFPTNVISTVLAIPVLLLLPGWTWMRAIERRTRWAPDALERLGYGAALSVAALALGGVAMSKLSVALTPTSWMLLVAGLTVPALLTAAGSVGSPAGAGAEPPAAATGSLRRTMAVVFAGLLGIAALVGAVVVTLRSDAVNRDPLTGLGVRRDGVGGESVVVADVRNMEGRAVDYLLRFRTAGGDIARFERRLSAGARWVRWVPADDPRYRGATLQVQLLRADHPGVYRAVRLARDAALPADCDRLAGTPAFVACATSLLVEVGAPSDGLLRLPGFELRVLGSRWSTGGVDLDVRLRNTSGRRVAVTETGPFGISIGAGAAGDRTGSIVAGPRALGADAVETYRVAFGLDADDRRALTESAGRFRIVPDRGPDRPDAGDGPPCSSVATRTGTVVCTTPSATLTLVGEGAPLAVPGLEVKVLRSRFTGRSVDVDLRVRSAAREAFLADGGHFYLSVGGRRQRGAALGRAQRLSPGAAATVRVRFLLDRPLRARIAAGASSDLGVTPVDQGRSRRLGVVRLTPSGRRR